MNENPINYLGNEKLNRNENFATSISVHTPTAFTVRSQLFQTSRSSIQPVNNFNSPMNRQLQQGMASPPFKRITRKCHSGSQTQLTYPPKNYASFNDFLTKPPLPEWTVSEVRHHVGVDRFSPFPYAKVVTNNKADTIIRFMQNHIVNHAIQRNIRCDQAQDIRAKKLLIYCKSNHIKLIFHQ